MAVAVMLATGCAYAGATPDPNAGPTATPAPPTPSEPVPSKTTDTTERPLTVRPDPECLVGRDVHQEASFDDMTRQAKVIVAATFDGYGAAVWDTLGGMRPSLAEFEAATASIVRPLHLTPFSTIRGAGVSLAAAQVLGGTIGCDQVTVDPQLDVTQGSRYVFYLLPVMNSAGVFGDRLQAPIALSVTADDRVLTPDEQPMTLSSLPSFAASHPYAGSP